MCAVCAGGLHSYRFVEVLSFGCIPVLLADDWVPPFTELASFSAYGIRVPEAEWADIPRRLVSIPTPIRAELHSAVVAVYERFFRNPLQAAMEITVSRLPELRQAGASSSMAS